MIEAIIERGVVPQACHARQRLVGVAGSAGILPWAGVTAIVTIEGLDPLEDDVGVGELVCGREVMPSVFPDAVSHQDVMRVRYQV